jgi:serine acetyltransferase
MQQVTIGGPKVTIGDYVEINAGAKIISNIRGRGSLSIGNNVIIAAGAVVVHDVHDNCVVAGNPAKVVKYISPEDNWLNFRMRRNLEHY